MNVDRGIFFFSNFGFEKKKEEENITSPEDTRKTQGGRLHRFRTANITAGGREGG